MNNFKTQKYNINTILFQTYVFDFSKKYIRIILISIIFEQKSQDKHFEQNSLEYLLTTPTDIYYINYY